MQNGVQVKAGAQHVSGALTNSLSFPARRSGPGWPRAHCPPTGVLLTRRTSAPPYHHAVRHLHCEQRLSQERECSRRPLPGAPGYRGSFSKNPLSSWPTAKPATN